MNKICRDATQLMPRIPELHSSVGRQSAQTFYLDISEETESADKTVRKARQSDRRSQSESQTGGLVRQPSTEYQTGREK